MAGSSRPYFSSAERAVQRIYDETGMHLPAEIAYAQWRFESGDFASDVAREGFNFGGMKTAEDTGLRPPDEEYNADHLSYARYSSPDEYADSWADTVSAYINDSGIKNSGKTDLTLEDLVNVLHPSSGPRYSQTDPSRYLQGVASKLGADVMFAPVDRMNMGAWGTRDGYAIPRMEDEEATFGDKFAAQFYDNGIVAGIRTVWKDIEAMESIKDLPLLNNYQPDEEDIQMVQKMLPGNITAQTYVLNNATSRKALMSLTQMKVEDIERERKVENSGFGFSTLGTVAGLFADPFTLLSLALPGVGVGGLGAKAMNVLSKSARARAAVSFMGQQYNQRKALKYAVGSLSGMAMAGADRYLASTYGGFTPNYEIALAMGGVFGGIGAKLAIHPEPVKPEGQLLLGGGNRMEQAFLPGRSVDNQHLLTASNIIYGNPPDIVRTSKLADIQNAVEDATLRWAEGTPVSVDTRANLFNDLSSSAERGEMEHLRKLQSIGVDAPPSYDMIAQAANMQKAIGNKAYNRLLKRINNRLKAKNKTGIWVDVAQNAKTPEGALMYALRNHQAEFIKFADMNGVKNLATIVRGSNLDTQVDAWTRLANELRGANNTEGLTLKTTVRNLIKNNRLAIVPMRDAQRIARSYGITIRNSANGFSIPGTDLSVLIREKITKQNLDGLIAHEIGVHNGLRSVLTKEGYDKLMAMVENKLRHSKDQIWRDAARMGGTAEEALAYWAERKFGKNSNDTILKTLKKLVRYPFNKESDEELVDLITRSIQTVSKTEAPIVAKSTGYSINGVEYNNNNMWTPLIDELLIPTNMKSRFDIQAQNIAESRPRVKNQLRNPREGQLALASGREGQQVLPGSENIPIELPERLDTPNATNRNTEDVSINMDDRIQYSEDDVDRTIYDYISDRGKAANERQNSRLFAPFGIGKVAKWIESGPLYGSLYGILANSRVPGLQRLGKALMKDPTDVASDSIEMSAEELKATIRAPLMNLYNEFVDLRSDYINKTTAIYGRGNNRIRAVNKQIVDCFNVMFGKSERCRVSDFPPEIQEMAKKMKEVRDGILEAGKKTNHEYGMGLDGDEVKGLIDPDWIANVEEFYRCIDEDKFTDVMSRFFKSRDEMLQFLHDYAKAFVNYDEMRRRYKVELKKRLDEWKEKTKNVKNPTPFDQRKDFLTWDKFLDDECKNWAYGIVDRDISNMKWDGKSKGNGDIIWRKEDSLTQFKHRLPIDTSKEMNIPGTNIKFSFDNDLRDYDIDMFLPQIINRSAGEIAMHSKLKGKTIEEVLDKARQDIEHERSLVGSLTADRELDALTNAVCQILGSGRYDLQHETRLDAWGRILRTLSYANVGGNMMFAQLGEFGAMMAYGGFKTVLSVCPSLARRLRESRLGKADAQLVENVNRQLFAEDIATRAWGVTSSTESRTFRHFYGRRSEIDARPGRFGSTMDSIAKGSKRLGLLASTVNRLPKLTDAMLMDMRKSVIEDSLQWAGGKQFSRWRNPFSKAKMRAAGINDQMTEDLIKADIKRYLIDRDGDINGWAKNNPSTYYAWKKLVDNQSMRGMQQMSVGGTSLLKENHPIIFQFKDFTMRAVNGQTLRALTTHDADDALAALYSMATNTATYIALTEARAYAMYPENELSRRRFLDKQLTGERLALVALTRGALTGSLLSLLMDAYEAFTGNAMFRTTVDNTYRNNSTFDTSSGSASYNITRMLGNAARQAPAINTVVGGGLGLYGAARLATGQGNRDDWDSMVRSLPLGSWIGMTYLSSYAKEDLHLRKG